MFPYWPSVHFFPVKQCGCIIETFLLDYILHDFLSRYFGACVFLSKYSNYWVTYFILFTCFTFLCKYISNIVKVDTKVLFLCWRKAMPKCSQFGSLRVISASTGIATSLFLSKNMFVLSFCLGILDFRVR